jgi:hypothetical protein
MNLDLRLTLATASFSLLLLLASCSSDENQAKAAVLEILDQPEAAIFGDFTELSTEIDGRTFEMACLSVKTQNASGGYSGFADAALIREKGEQWLVVTFSDDTGHEGCVEDLKTFTEIKTFEAIKKLLRR